LPDLPNHLAAAYIAEHLDIYPCVFAAGELEIYARAAK